MTNPKCFPGASPSASPAGRTPVSRVVRPAVPTLTGRTTQDPVRKDAPKCVPKRVPTLFDAITAHCFFGWCKHTVTDLSADNVHDTMEHHYATTHRDEINALLPRVTIRAGVLR